VAAYHFTAKIHSRASGASAVRAAAYRAAERLVDERMGRAEDYTRKQDVIESAILTPEGAPAWTQDREQLWNRVEARERRRDAQLAQEFEINLPRELSDAENWGLATDFCRQHLVARGRICDVNFHLGEASDGQAHPHVHILMPLRELDGPGEDAGFGEKHPDASWRSFIGSEARLKELRQAWGDFARSRAAELGIDLGPEWDHRSFETRGIDLEGQPKIGATAQRMEQGGEGAERTAELLAAQRRNGERLLADPGIALQALTQQQSTFTEHDLARYIHRHTAEDQFSHAFEAAKATAVRIGRDEAGQERFSSAEMIGIERQMASDAEALAARQRHPVRSAIVDRILDRSQLSEEQLQAARTIVGSGDIACLTGYAGSGKSTMLAEARRVWEAQGYRVRGASLSGIAAENLEAGSGIDSRTLASLAYGWTRGRDLLTENDVLVIDEAGMIGSRQLGATLALAEAAGAKVVLVGDPEQLQAIEAGAAFRAISERVGTAELTEVRRQQTAWQRAATQELATGQTTIAVDRYRASGAIEAAPDREAAREAVVAAWTAGEGQGSRIMLAHSRDDVRALNEAARAACRASGGLGPDQTVQTSRGQRDFAAGDRIMFLRNDRAMGVKNGTVGTLTRCETGGLTVETDDGRAVAFDPAAYRDIDHGYAATVHKAQGVTVDRAYVLATPGFDRHLSYVAMSRHREALHMVYAESDFATPAALAETMGRARLKDTSLDYAEAMAETRALEREAEPPRPSRWAGREQGWGPPRSGWSRTADRDDPSLDR
jgi:Ti-type conjugative transfer relaxase TraA